MTTNTHPKFSAELLPEGTKVDSENHILNRRVVCVCTITVPDRVVQFQGISIRSPQDRWDPALGLEIALHRAVKNWWISENDGYALRRPVQWGVLRND